MLYMNDKEISGSNLLSLLVRAKLLFESMCLVLDMIPFLGQVATLPVYPSYINKTK